MAERVTFGLDFDGVMVRKAPVYDLLRRSTKMGLPPVEGVADALSLIENDTTLSIAGVYTVRPDWLRKAQTERQIRRHGFGIERVIHTTNSPIEKVRHFLVDSVGYHDDSMFGGVTTRQENGQYVPNEDRWAVLVDDSYGKIKQALDEVGQDREFHHLLNRFAFFVFGKTQEQINTGKKFDPVMPMVSPGIHVKAGLKDGKVTYAVPIVALPNWRSLPEALRKLSEYHSIDPYGVFA